ncbi:MAG: lysine--tRNA ligase [Candidatus Pacebacteria bacterium]|nr:lysine--tRNA ligase [Candidatus Paceibacterota bacterium]
MVEEERTHTQEEIRTERLAKSAILTAHGQESYPAHSARTHELVQVRTDFANLEEGKNEVTIAGRVMAVRTHGGAVFVDLFDGTASLQGYLKKDEVGDEVFTLFIDTVDRGDFIELVGTAFTTKRGEPSLLVKSWHMLAKSLLPIPTEHFGIKDEDERYRKRYLDILLNKEVAERVRRRSIFWNTARTFLLTRGFVEVETPVLETMPGGAEARPFSTHHNALDLAVHLRICAGELWQKKLMIAGIPKTFEIGRVFRNEGMSAEHAQDYTALEFYEAYSDYHKGKTMVRELYLALARETFGVTTFTVREHTFDLASEWQEYDFSKILLDTYGFDPRTVDEATVLAVLAKSGVQYDRTKPMTFERAVDTLWKKCRVTLSGPGFLTNVPVYMEPLAKRSSVDPRVVERFQVVLAGSEVGKGFSELNDPVDQRTRFARQDEMRKAGDEEAQFADIEFVEAMEYGMPPTFGFGVSERLFSFLAGVPIREGQVFPLMRPKF